MHCDTESRHTVSSHPWEKLEYCVKVQNVWQQVYSYSTFYQTVHHLVFILDWLHFLLGVVLSNLCRVTAGSYQPVDHHGRLRENKMEFHTSSTTHYKTPVCQHTCDLRLTPNMALFYWNKLIKAGKNIFTFRVLNHSNSLNFWNSSETAFWVTLYLKVST